MANNPNGGARICGECGVNIPAGMGHNCNPSYTVLKVGLINDRGICQGFYCLFSDGVQINEYFNTSIQRKIDWIKLRKREYASSD